MLMQVHCSEGTREFVQLLGERVERASIQRDDAVVENALPLSRQILLSGTGFRNYGRRRPGLRRWRDGQGSCWHGCPREIEPRRDTAA